MTYSHRNGETEPPTVEGYYWYVEDDDTPGKHNDSAGVAYMLHGGDCVGTFGRVRHTSQLPGKWWGPVIPPWQEDAA